MFTSKAAIQLKYDGQFQDNQNLEEDKLKIAARSSEPGEILIKKDQIKKAYSFMIDDVEVFFPHKPYEAQQAYMNEVIKTLKKPK